MNNNEINLPICHKYLHSINGQKKILYLNSFPITEICTLICYNFLYKNDHCDEALKESNWLSQSLFWFFIAGNQLSQWEYDRFKTQSFSRPRGIYFNVDFFLFFAKYINVTILFCRISTSFWWGFDVRTL